MTRRWLVLLSLVAHAAAAVFLFATGVWQLERLEAGRTTVAIGMMVPPGDPGGGEEGKRAPEKRAPKATVKKTVVKKLVQVEPKTDPTPLPAASEVDARGAGAGDGDGDGDGNSDGEGNGDGSAGGALCDGTGPCDAAPSAPVMVPTVPLQIVPPTLFSALRISGDTQIVPSDPDKTAMLRQGTDRTVGTLKVCLDTTGRISTASIVGTTKYPSYDARLLTAVRTWRYQPYRVNGTPAPACSVVTFVYTIR